MGHGSSLGKDRVGNCLLAESLSPIRNAICGTSESPLTMLWLGGIGAFQCKIMDNG